MKKRLFQTQQIALIWFRVCLAVFLLASAGIHGQPYGLTSRPQVGAFLNNALPPQEQTGDWTIVEAFPNLTFNDPVMLVPAPRTNLLFVIEQAGKIWSFQNTSSVVAKTLVLDISATTQSKEDCGLLGLAFHPDFGLPGSTNRGYFYISYSYSPSPTQNPGPSTRAYNRLSRYTIADGASTASPASQSILINQYDEDWWHNGGGMFFGPDGFLYLSCGDEGAAADSYNNSQKINGGFFSGVLRIDVNMDPTKSHPIRRQPLNGGTPPAGWTNSFSTNYFIPNDNPWLDVGGTVLEEYYCIGLRSPHRMSYDAPSGQIWLGDVGQSAREEVNIIEKGGNYQWAYAEGAVAGPKAKPNQNQLIGVEKPPLYEYPHTDGNNCVIGGFVYRGNRFAAQLYGKYIFGDNGSSRVWAMDTNTSPATITLLGIAPVGALYSYSHLGSFGVDHDNEIYILVVGQSRKIYKLSLGGVEVSPPPALLSQVGAFSNLLTLAPSASLVPYTVNSPLWSDGADKQRWLAIPNNGAPYTSAETIGFATNGAWSFPTGTVLVKHFDLPTNETNSAERKRLETRFMVRGTNGAWYGLTYKWRADNSEADLLPGSLLETNLITTATGTRTQVWFYPSRSDCLTCHNQTANSILGLRTCQLNGNYTYPASGITDNQLRALNNVGMFSPGIVESNIPAYDASVPITNTSASLELRVRSYLDANCAHCHRPNGVKGFFDARFDTPLASQNIVGGTVAGNLGIAGASVVKPQSIAQSILYVRDNALGSIQMPPLAKNLVDTNYINGLGEWINSLDPVVSLPNLPIGRVGNTNDGTLSDNIWDVSPYINAVRFQASSNFNVSLMRAKVLGVTGKYQCAIYADNAGVPGSVLGTTLEVTNPVTGWQTFPLTSLVTLTNGQFGWMAIWSDSSAAKVYYSSGSVTLGWGQYNYTSGVWPSPFIISGQGTLNYCINAHGGSPPTFVQTPANRTVPATSLLTVTNAATDPDLPFQQLSYYLISPPAGATISSNGIITWTPSVAQVGSNLLATAVTDGLVSRSNSFLVLVTNANQSPVAFSQSLTNAEDTALGILLGMADPDGPVTNYMVLTNPIHGVISGSVPNLTYWPVTNYFGPDSLSFRVNDGSLTSALAVVSILITNVNDAPIAGSDSLSRFVSQGITAPVAALITNDTDVEGNPISLVSVLDATPPGSSINQTSNQITYWPSFGSTNAGAFSYTISDGQGGAATGMVAVTVMPDPAGADQLGIVLGTPPDVTVQLSGIPGFTYTVQFTENLTPPAWQNLTNAVADGSGLMQVFDTNGGTNRFYRAVRGLAP
jgi:uncharacterized repeat protein (TIGR03806 family)